MKQTPETPTLSIQHQPFGEFHPYLPLPTERSPRNPATDDMVKLRVATGHNPSAETVWCVWQIEGDTSTNQTDAVKVATDQTSDLWQVQLPAFNGGEVIHYRLFARKGNQQVESEEFSFSVLTWLDVIAVTSVEQMNERLVVTLATDRPNLFIGLQAEPEPGGTITLRLSSVEVNKHSASKLPLNDPLIAEIGDLRITLYSNPLRLVLKRESDNLVLETIEPIRILARANGTVLQCKLEFKSPSDEAFYGFGERFNAFDQRGNRLDNYVYGQYTDQGKRSYIPIPFFISSRGYAYWLRTDCQAEFDLAAAQTDCWTVTGLLDDPIAGLEMKFFFQQQPRSIIKAFTDLTGKPKLPPAWVFGLWMSSNDWNSQAEIIHQLHLTQQHQIPASVLVIEAWSDEINFYIWNDAHYQQKPSSQKYSLTDFHFPAEGHWPDPKAMVDELHQADVRLVLWQIPVIKHGEARENLDKRLNIKDQEYAIQHGFVVQKADGSPHRVEAHMPWFAGSLVLDFTNPEAADWWLKKREYLLTELGIDGFKTDGGEHVWDPETRFYNGMRGSRGINTYPIAYEGAYQRFLETHRGKDYVLFSRAGYTGAQGVPCHWAGDENSTWDAFRASIRAMLNVGLCGVPFMGWDIAGFAGPIPSSELYLRATAFSVFCPIMQYHSDGNGRRIPSRDRTPWNIQEQTGDRDVIPIFREFANLRMNLLPYILGLAWESSQTGVPLMRPLFLDYPDDAACREFPYQYMFGDALLVAPVIDENVTLLPVYLPQGEWRDFWTGEYFRGPRTIDVKVPRDRIPVFQKAGSIVALQLGHSGELGSPIGNDTEQSMHLTLRIVCGVESKAPILLPRGNKPIWITVEAYEGEDAIEIQLPALPQGADLVILSHDPTSVAINGQLLPRLNRDDFERRTIDGWWVSTNQEIRIHLAEINQPARITIR